MIEINKTAVGREKVSAMVLYLGEDDITSCSAGIGLKAVHTRDDGATASEVLNSRKFGMTIRPNHLSMALQCHRHADRRKPLSALVLAVVIAERSQGGWRAPQNSNPMTDRETGRELRVSPGA